jgi:hypothetical protein
MENGATLVAPGATDSNSNGEVTAPGSDTVKLPSSSFRSALHAFAAICS